MKFKNKFRKRPIYFISNKFVNNGVYAVWCETYKVYTKDGNEVYSHDLDQALVDSINGGIEDGTTEVIRTKKELVLAIS